MNTTVFILIAAVIALVAVALPAAVKPTKGHGHRNNHLNRELVFSRWTSLMATSKTGASGLKTAVGEADKLLDYVLRESGYPGVSLADKLKVAQSKLSNRDAVWRAHKLRNSIAHDIDFDLVPSMAHEALQAFERGLKDLGAL